MLVCTLRLKCFSEVVTLLFKKHILLQLQTMSQCFRGLTHHFKNIRFFSDTNKKADPKSKQILVTYIIQITTYCTILFKRAISLNDK